MAEASFHSSSNERSDIYTLSSLTRNDDAMTLRLRSDGPVGIDELINLNQATSTSPVVASSSGTTTVTEFSSRKESITTKPTSAGTSYPVKGYTGKGKATATYASSLSATQGSASEAEAEVDAARDNALVGVGDWMAESSIAAAPLKGSSRARKRQHAKPRPKHKKPPVVIFQHQSTACASSDDECPTVAKLEARCNSRDVKYLRYRRSKPGHNDQLQQAEEWRLSEAPTLTLPSAPLSRARSYVVISLVIAIVLTFALSTFAAHHTGKMRMACTKGIIFAASVLMSCFTILAIVVARHALQTALLAGLLEFLVGFALVVEVHEFMA